MRLALVLAAVVTLAGSGAGWATTLPIYPVDQLCVALADGKVAGTTRCVQEQQEEHDAIAFGDVADDGSSYQWDMLPEQIQNRCIYYVAHPFGRKQPYPYIALRVCIEDAFGRYVLSYHNTVPHFQP